MLDWAVKALWTVGGIAGVSITLLYFFQDKLLYVPRVPGMPDQVEGLTPERYGFRHEDLWLTAQDGTRLHAWLLTWRSWSPSEAASKPLLMFFQENAGNMSHRLPYLRYLAQQLDVVLLAPSYRGYGLSEGKPSQGGIMQDAQAALDYVLSHESLSQQRLYVMGRSLGGAVAIHLAADNEDKLHGLMVENTFMSVEDMAAQILPPLGALIGEGKAFNWLVTNKWNNLREIGRIQRLPLLLMASERDEMVPFKQMERLRSAAVTRSVTWVTFPDATHMDAYLANPGIYRDALRKFMASCVQCRAAAAAGPGARAAAPGAEAAPPGVAAAAAAGAAAIARSAAAAAGGDGGGVQ